jgi:SAM-dependent methyltransferase
MVRGYREDLAYIHDVGFGHFAKSAAPGLLQLLRQMGTIGGPVVDLGCGSGIWARELCNAGYDVLGVDLSADMIALARKRVPEAEFRQDSFLTAKLPPCAAVTAIGECFNFLFDSRNTKRTLQGLFRRVYDALLPGGLLIFDVAGPGCVPAPGVRKSWEGEDWAVLVVAEEDRHRKLLTRRITSFRKIGKLYRRNEEVHRLRLYTPPELASELRDCGFRVRTLRRYGQLRLRRGLTGFLARKP